MLSFDSSTFAIAGGIAAAGPVLIHLLNRRRFKTVNWAAMDFLREALERNRRILEIRDILLLALRMLAVALFGFALARPYYKGATTAALLQAGLLTACVLAAMALAIAWVLAPKRKRRGLTSLLPVAALVLLAIPGYIAFRQSSAASESPMNSRLPVHAVLVIDNSRSLGVETIGATLLDRAKERAIEFAETLPPESRITVIPLAGSEEAYTLDAYRNKEDARRAIERVKLVDTEGSVRIGLEQADQACRQSVDLPAKRVVLLTDAQANAWQTTLDPELLKRLSGLQIVDLTTAPAANVWISGLHIEDGLTSAEVPCRILARLHASAADSPDETASSSSFEVQVKLTIDGTETDSQAVELSPGQVREIAFAHHFDQVTDPLRPSFSTVAVSVQSDLPATDRLVSDNRQQVVVPVVASLPVIFVDQYGDSESLEAGRIGETHALRHLMAPHSSSDTAQRRLIRVEHLRQEQLTQELLETARLVVMAGVEKPDETSVTLLRDFVRQGGPLVIMAGGRFDSSEWTEQAWLGGRGILPAPLNPKPFGETPEQASRELQPFHASFASMQHDFFLVEGEDPKSLSVLFESTPFFKAVQADLDPGVLAELLKSDQRWLSDEKRQMEDPATSTVNEPTWWNWRSPIPLIDRSKPAEELAKQYQPRTLAAFHVNNLPFVVERRMGAGRVILFTSGVSSNWNLLRSSGAMYLFHRTFCQLMEGTLPVRNFHAGQKIMIPVEQRQATRYSLVRPAGARESVNVDAISQHAFGVSIRRPLMAGIYSIQTSNSDPAANESDAQSQDVITLAVNGAESESDLTTIPVRELQQRLGPENARVLTANEPIRIEGGAHRGQDIWKPLGACVLGCLLIEQLVLAWPLMTKRQAPQAKLDYSTGN